MKAILCGVLWAMALLPAVARPADPVATLDAGRIVLAAPRDVLEDYTRLVAGRPVESITNFAGPGSRRDVVEIVLVQQALRIGRVTATIEFVPLNSYRRILTEVAAGAATISPTSAWHDDLQALSSDLYISIPVVDEGAFVAGLYTLPENQRALSIRSLGELRQLTVASNPAWTADWKTLTALKLPHLIQVNKWESMVRMVAAGRADILLAPFQPTADMSLQVQGIRLTPIPGVKLPLKGTRHFALTRQHPKSAELLLRFNDGLSQLKKSGIVAQAYRDAGFFNPRVDAWADLSRLPE